MVVGAAFATRARSVPAAVAIGGLTHLLLDAVPHRDYDRKALRGLALPVDAGVGCATVWRLSGGSTTVLAGSFGGALPDALRVAERAAGVKVTTWAHDTSHSDARPNAWLSVAVQALFALAATVVLAVDA